MCQWCNETSGRAGIQIETAYASVGEILCVSGTMADGGPIIRATRVPCMKNILRRPTYRSCLESTQAIAKPTYLRTCKNDIRVVVWVPHSVARRQFSTAISVTFWKVYLTTYYLYYVLHIPQSASISCVRRCLTW
jgi:hypothetical protein